MSEDLVLTGFRYVGLLPTSHAETIADKASQNIANLVFFVPYIVFQPPSTILCRALGPRFHLAGITIFWGAAMIGMGFVKNYGQLTGMRALLGILEAGFFPSCVYLLSTWYTRCEYARLRVEWYGTDERGG